MADESHKEWATSRRSTYVYAGSMLSQEESCWPSQDPDGYDSPSLEMLFVPNVAIPVITHPDPLSLRLLGPPNASSALLGPGWLGIEEVLKPFAV